MPPPDLYAVLEKLLRGCEGPPAAVDNHDPLPSAKGPLPKRLEQLLTEYTEPLVQAVMSELMKDFGSRVFRVLLRAGMNREDWDTDLAQNQHDLWVAADLLLRLAIECSNTPILPRTTGELLHRIANALFDKDSNSRSALFDGFGDTEFPRWTAGRQCEGRLAAALQILRHGRMKLADAQDWLEAEMRKAGLVDEAGNQISAKRIRFWRNNFRRGVGASHARTFYDQELTDQAQRLAAPNKDCEDLARRLIRLLAHSLNRTVPQPLKRTPPNQFKK